MMMGGILLLGRIDRYESEQLQRKETPCFCISEFSKIYFSGLIWQERRGREPMSETHPLGYESRNQRRGDLGVSLGRYVGGQSSIPHDTAWLARCMW